MLTFTRNMDSKLTTKEGTVQATRLSKFTGSLIGAVIGDCLGATFDRPGAIGVKHVNPFFERLAEDSKDKNSVSISRSSIYPYTDDTAMARTVAVSLIEHRRLDTKDLAKRFVDEYFKEPDRGYGKNVGNVFKLLKKQDFEDPFGPASEQFEGKGSWGNGGAMRIVPASLFGYKFDEDKFTKLVKDISKITHSNILGINGAILQARATQLALLSTESKLTPTVINTFLDNLLSLMDKLEQCDSPRPIKKQRRDSNDDSDIQPYSSYCHKLKAIKKFIESQEDVPREEVVEILGNNVSALGSVPAAIYSFFRSAKPVDDIKTDNPFERTIRYAITLGGDTDTIATMAGAIAGAFYGNEQINPHWKEISEGVKDAEDFAKKLNDICEEV